MSLAILLTGFSGNAQQKDTLFINDVYENVGESLMIDEVIKFDSINQITLKRRFENYAGTWFRNYNEVVTSSTEEQIVMLYIESLGSDLNMYIRLVVQFKDNKVRLRFYDDGNVYKPAVYSGNTLIARPIAARSFKLSNYFTSDGMLIYNKKPGSFNVKEKAATMIKNYIEELNLQVSEIENSIRANKNNSNSEW